MSGKIYGRIYTSNTLILMIATSFLCWKHVWMNAFMMSTTATSLCSSASIMNVSSTDSVAMVGELASYLEIKSLCLLTPDTVITLMVPSLFYFRNIWDSSVCFLCSYDMLFQCIRRKMSLIY